MMDLEIFNRDVDSYLFVDGETENKWGIVNKVNVGQEWPIVYIWIAAANRPSSPEKYYLRFKLDGYPNQPPEICVWDMEKNSYIDPSQTPKGKAGSNVAIVFRHDTWSHGRHLYAPFERHAFIGHADWATTYPNEHWKKSDTIVKVTEYLHRLLNSPDYEGITKA